MDRENLIWVREAPDDFGPHTRKSRHLRRSHKKSRGGCQSCKARRVKCDETKPVCGQCQNRDAECKYHLRPGVNGSRYRVDTQSSAILGDGSAPYTATNFSAEACMGMHVFATAISRAVNQRSATGLSNNSLAYMLQHFERTGYATVSSRIGQGILHDQIPRILMAHSFLMHAVLAFSSSHLGHMSRSRPHQVNMVLTARYHTQRALRLYSDHIHLHQRDHSYSRMKHPSGLEEMDALFAASILLKSLFFYMDEVYLPWMSWTVSPPNTPPLDGRSEPSIDWISNTSGLNVVFSLRQFRKKLSESIWRPFFEEVNRLNEHPSKEVKHLGGEPRGVGPPTVQNNFSAPPSWDPPTCNTSSTSSSGVPTSSSEMLPQNIHDIYPYPATSTNLPNIPPGLLRLALSSPNLPIYSPALVLLDPILALDPTNLNYFGASSRSRPASPQSSSHCYEGKKDSVPPTICRPASLPPSFQHQPDTSTGLRV